MNNAATPTHRLSLAVRVVNHFSGEPLTEELPLRLAGSFQRPVMAPGGGGHRQPDGAYRFIDVPDGMVTLLWREPFALGHGGWMRCPEGDPQFTLPLPRPTAWVEFPLWPAPQASVPAGTTGVRGRLVGPGVARLTVRIAASGEPFDRYTCSDDNGEFLFLPPGRLDLDTRGLVPLTIEVLDGAGLPRPVDSGHFVPDAAGSAFAGANFKVPPRSVSRIVFRLV